MNESEISAQEHLIASEPEGAPPYRRLASLYRDAGRAADAAAAELVAAALDARAPLAIYNIATAYLTNGQDAPAAQFYRLALRLDPDLTIAHQNLAAILERQGNRREAQAHRDAAFRQQNIFVETAAAPRRSVLILSASGFGNVPIDFLFPHRTTTRIKWFVDYASDGQGDRLPAFDLVFNAVGDADMAGPPQREVARFLERCDKPVLNRPEQVRRTYRDLLPDLLAGIDHVVVPAVRRVSRDSVRGGAVVGFPQIVRPIGSHGGKGVILAKTQADLEAADLDEAEAFYVTEFHDYRSGDGQYRKYRMIFVDRVPFPYHLAISRDWLVHYFSADMKAEPWKRAEEQRFLEDPAAALGEKATVALAAIGKRLDLDFCGIDFAVLSDGRLLVFEANATMLVHLEDLEADFPYKHVHVPKIFAAFEEMLVRHSLRISSPAKGRASRPSDR